ncbi:RluA family pseudouridine synthase [Sporosarcina sp. G11-34]|nr:RluA family pseudouridine synthase [Sporosarcina sp. G11-34]
MISKRTLAATKYEGGLLLVNGIERDVRYLLREGDEVKILFPPEIPSKGLVVEHGDLAIVFEDEAILILDKPPGQSTMTSQNHQSGTIANYVAGKFSGERIPATVHIVTRLDHNTSGLVCIAKNRHIHHLFGDKIIKSGFHREYEAVVEGHIQEDIFSITERIGRKDGSIIERIVREDGQEARTDVRVIQRYTKNGHDLTRIRLILHTGRTHQIRVHMQWLGHPIAGDDLYGGSQILIARQALHCALLEFTHPITGVKQTFRGELADDMASMLMERL